MIVNVCGAGSSGTTFLAVMLDRHPRIACGDELYLFNKPLLYRSFGRLRRLRRLFRAHGLSASPQHPDRSLLRNLEGFGLDPDRVWRWVAECPTIEALAARFHAHIRALTGKPVWAEKTPSNSRTATLFARHFPADRVIHLVRDPRDQALSRMRRGVDLDTAAWIWLTAVAAIQPLRGSDRLLELRYEDLALDFDAQMLRICKFLGLPCEPHWFHLDTHVSHGLSRSSGHVSWQSRPNGVPSAASIGRYCATTIEFGPLLCARLSAHYASLLATPCYSVAELMAVYGYAVPEPNVWTNGGRRFLPLETAGPIMRRFHRLLDGDRPRSTILI